MNALGRRAGAPVSRPAIIAIVLVALAGLGFIWFISNFDLVDERRPIGLQGEARRNDFLAAERLLARMGVAVRHVKTAPELRELPRDGTLLLPDRRDALTPDAREQLLAWVEAGGHLIVEDEDHRVPDPILDALEVGRVPAQAPWKSPTVLATLPHAPHPMRVDMHARQTLEAPFATVKVESEHATHLVHFPLERGRVTVLNDIQFLRNRSIGHNDHAEFLWQIVRFQPGTSAVFVFDNPHPLSLRDWLVANAWAVLVSGVALLVLWLWHIAVRFGPVAPDPEPARRRLLDHLRASGRFQWSHGGGTTLIEAAREAALRQVARAHPDFAALARTAQERRLTELFEIAPSEARLILGPPQPRNAGEFIAAADVYQRIHERLARRTTTTESEQ